MLNGITDSQKVWAQKAAAAVQSSGSNFVLHRSEDWLEIEMLKKSLRKHDEAMRQRDEFYTQAIAQ
jgi:hypothetical protein